MCVCVWFLFVCITAHKKLDYCRWFPTEPSNSCNICYDNRAHTRSQSECAGLLSGPTRKAKGAIAGATERMRRFERLDARPRSTCRENAAVSSATKCLLLSIATIAGCIATLAISTFKRANPSCERFVLEPNPSVRLYSYGMCVVGNGPLSTDDRRNIAACKTVARFNDLRNMREGERMDVHVLREWKNTDDFAGAFFDECSNASIVCVGQSACATASARHIPTVGLYRRDVFSSCPVQDAAVNAHPSTGTIYLSWLEETHSDVHRIDVFGMNWNLPAFQHNGDEAALVHECCSKCVVHPTPSSEYGWDRA